MRSRLGHQYSSLYSYPLPTERKRNYWPIVFAVILVGLCGLFVWWILDGRDIGIGSLFGSTDAPTESDRMVTLQLGGQQFYVPANYLRSRDIRSGGAVEQIDLYAIWPSMQGFNPDDADSFRDKSESSPIIYITLTAPAQFWRPAERFYQVYPYYFAGPETVGPYGLMSRRMDDGSGLGDHDVFYFQDTDDFYLFHCLRDKSDLIPSDCVADKVIEPRILARYRFRRAMLADWRQIEQDVETLLEGFAGQ